MPTRTGLPVPPLDTEEVTGGGPGWVRLMTARGDIDAHLVEGRLNEAGIEVRSIKDHSGPVWLFGGSDPWGPVEIWVRKIQYDDSHIVLAELAFDGPPAVTDSGPLGWSPTVWWAAAIGLGLLLTAIGFVRSADYIDRCGFSVSCPQPEAGP